MTTKPVAVPSASPPGSFSGAVTARTVVTGRVLIEPSRDGEAVTQGMQEAAWDIARAVLRQREQSGAPPTEH